jgi:hypothetical protein
MTWGAGQIGPASISTLAKDLRRRFMGLESDFADWALADDYTIQGVADRLIEMLYDELYAPLGMTGELGFLVAGFSGASKHAEAWTVTLTPAGRPTPELAANTDQHGWMAYAQASAIQRLFNGWDDNLMGALAAGLTPEELAKVFPILNLQRNQPAVAPMPFADAIGLAGFLVDVTVGYSGFLLGPDTVGGPGEIAGISRHEGFKWISRKHYYDPALNPGDPGHDYE